MAINIAGQTLTGNTPPADPPKSKVGRIVLDATVIVATDHLLVTLGYTPKYIKFVNVTDRVQGEWFEGMAAESCVKTAATGVRTLEAAAGITICDTDGTPNVSGRCFKVLQNATLGLVLASKTVQYIAGS